MTTGRPKRLKLEERIELARRYHAGETPKVLAEAYGVSRRHVTRLAKEGRGEGQEVRNPSVTVSFRAARSEMDAFDAEWRARGFGNRSQSLQALVRARCGFLDAARDDLQGFAETLRMAQDVSDAGRVLAKAVQRGKLALSPEDRDALSDLLDLAQRTHRDLVALKAAAYQRRGVGWTVDGSAAPAKDAEPPVERSDLHVHRPLLPLGSFETRTTIGSPDPENRNARNV